MNVLNQKTILVTRPNGETLAQMLRRRGAIVYCHPVIKIYDPPNWIEVDRAVEHLEDFEWLAFFSPNGVDRFVGRLLQISSIERLHEKEIAVIGEQTGQRLEHYGLRATLIPKQNDSQALSDALIGQPRIQSVLLIRGDRGSALMADRLAGFGVRFQEVIAYRTVDIHESSAEVLKMLKEHRFDWVTITSSAIAGAAVALWKENLRCSKLVSISPTTTTKLRELGYPAAAEARRFNLAGVIEAMERWTTS